MAVDVVKQDDSFVNTGDGLFYTELQCTTRAEIEDLSTKFRIGSKLVCTEDWSLWVLCRDGSTKAWAEVQF